MMIVFNETETGGDDHRSKEITYDPRVKNYLHKLQWSLTIWVKVSHSFFAIFRNALTGQGNFSLGLQYGWGFFNPTKVLINL
jgi:hypothetical protein